jgi:hypothetical protein
MAAKVIEDSSRLRTEKTKANERAQKAVEDAKQIENEKMKFIEKANAAFEAANVAKEELATAKKEAKKYRKESEFYKALSEKALKDLQTAEGDLKLCEDGTSKDSSKEPEKSIKVLNNDDSKLKLNERQVKVSMSMRCVIFFTKSDQN